MVSKKVMRFPSKVAVQGYQSLCFGKVPMSAKAYHDAINEGCVCTCDDFMEGVGCVGHR